MNNPVNTPTKSNGSVNTTAKTEAPVTEKTTNEQAIVTAEQKTIEVSTTQLQVVEMKSANAVFDRLDEGLRMKEQFNKAKERVGEFEDFSKDYGDEGLVMTIVNVGTSKNIQIQNVAMILDFINNLVKTGKTHLKAIETEIVNFTI